MPKPERSSLFVIRGLVIPSEFDIRNSSFSRFRQGMNPPAKRRIVPNEDGKLARQLGLFGTTMAVMGGIIGAGIFINPYIVAERVHTSALILGAWIAGGMIALAGGFIYAELAARLPVVGGQYAYLREALASGSRVYFTAGFCSSSSKPAGWRRSR